MRLVRVLGKLLLVILGLYACVTIGISNDMLKQDGPLTTDGVIYVVQLVLSVAYLHWVLYRFLVPLQDVTNDERKKIIDSYQRRYKKSFFAGSYGLGYFLLCLHVIALLDRSVSDRPSFLAAAIFFIALGTLARARAVLQYFLEKVTGPRKDAVEQAHEH